MIYKRIQNWLIQERPLRQRIIIAAASLSLGSVVIWFVYERTGQYIAAVTVVLTTFVTLFSGKRLGYLTAFLLALYGDYVFLKHTHGVFHYSTAVTHVFMVLLLSGLLILMVDYLRYFVKSILRLNDQLRHSEECYRVLTELSPSGVMVQTDDKWVFANQAALDILKVKDADTLLGTSIWNWVHPDDVEVIKKRIGTLRGGQKTAPLNDERLLTADGSVVHVSITGTIIPFNGKDSIHILIIDMSEQIRREQELREALSVRDTFIGIASHELRTPLTTIMMFVGMLRRNILKGESTEKLAEQATQQIHRLNRLIDEMLDVSRVTTGQLTIRKAMANLKEIITEAVERFNSHHAPIVTRLDHVEGSFDRIRIDQVITNLIANALKYGENKPVHVTLKKESDRAVISVEDQGMGISDEEQKLLFKKFERLPSAANRSGLGLGLYISQQIVMAHRGSITVKSSLGVGSTFTVSLPLE